MRYIFRLLVLLFSIGILGNAYACTSGSRYNLDSSVFTNNGWRQPIDGRLTTSTAYDYDSAIYYCNFNFRHGAYDIVADYDDPVYAIADGTVLRVVRNYSSTLNSSRIYIRHTSSKGVFIALYGHVFGTTNLKKGDQVEKGDVIGSIRKYGSPIHIHFGIHDTDDESVVFESWGSIAHKITDPMAYLENYKSAVPRSQALKMLMDKFNISSRNAGFNQTRFNQSVMRPTDVDKDTPYYDYIVAAYNKGIPVNNSKFRPNEGITLEEFVAMIVRAIPIPLNPPGNNNYPYSGGSMYKYINAAYNAGVITNQSYDFGATINKAAINDFLWRAYNYFLGDKSGISIYARWTKKYADIDLYLYSKPDSNTRISINTNSSGVITNMDELRNSGGVVYWNYHSSNWGTNLDYDSWGANGDQPWAGLGEERITVDSLRVRRPGKYEIILCYYDWAARQPYSATVEWWGIYEGRNINTGGGHKFTSTIHEGECEYVGYLKTN